MNCPLCIDQHLEALRKGGIEIDVCPHCHGVWLDRGELERLADLPEDPPALGPADGAPLDRSDAMSTGQARFDADRDHERRDRDSDDDRRPKDRDRYRDRDRDDDRDRDRYRDNDRDRYRDRDDDRERSKGKNKSKSRKKRKKSLADRLGDVLEDVLDL